MKITSIILFLLLFLSSCLAFAADSAIKPKNVAVVVNTVNINSLEIGEYYLKARGIPQENLIRVNIPDNPRRLSAAQFEQLKLQITEKLRPEIQVILLVWTAPYAVECNSITSALTLGFHASLCGKSCDPVPMSRYFNSSSRLPLEHGLRLSMLMPTESVETSKALIDRGVLSGFNLNAANAYFLITSSSNHNTRSKFFPKSIYLPEKKLRIIKQRGDSIERKKGIMIYHTGGSSVSNLDTLEFMPGALADHLTSFGGDLLGNGQMSSLRWLDAGATASYGTVSEPCNYWQKFPNSAVLLDHYLSGETAIEAYWKSVAWPTQGVFIGEPLAAPYCRTCALGDLQ